MLTKTGTWKNHIYTKLNEMTLYEVIHSLENIAMEQPNVRMVGHNHLYRDLNDNPSVKYRVFYVTQTSHKTTELWDVYGLNAFIIDRLKADGSNELEAESNAKETLDNILNVFCDRYGADIIGTRKYQPFTEKFVDETCGVYVTFEIQLPVDLICSE